MEVILRQHVENLGKRGEIVKVADGYARNYLLPRKLALLATDGNKKHVERERAKFDAVEAEEQKVASADRRPARGHRGDRNPRARSARPRRCTDRSRSGDIADALHAKGFDVDRRKMQLQEPIKNWASASAGQAPSRRHRAREGQGGGRRR